MGKPTGFREFTRKTEPYRAASERLLDYKELYTKHDKRQLSTQAARCMDCGVPFCQSDDGCPVYNLIPEWNDLIYQGHWREALDRLHETNNFPEFTGRVCPAPCEGACVLGVTDPAVTIKNIEMAIIDNGFAQGWVCAEPPLQRSGKRVAVVGSGPAGLAAAAQLNRSGHQVKVYEREDRVGGLLMYGIPNMKLSKKLVERRVNLLREEGVEFELNTAIGDGTEQSLDIRQLLAGVDALLLTTGATVPRDLHISGRHLNGIHFAMEFLRSNTKSLLDSNHTDGNYLCAKGKHVIVIGGGDTGTDCIGTALRHDCKSLVNFEILPRPPDARAADNPWPSWPNIFRVDYGHEEAREKFGRDPRVYCISGREFIGKDARLQGIKTVEMTWQSGRPEEIPGTEKIWRADLILLSMGFLGPEHAVSKPLGLDCDDRSNYSTSPDQYQTKVAKVFAAGDCRRGQSLVVRAISEGRDAAKEIDRFLMGSTPLR